MAAVGFHRRVTALSSQTPVCAVSANPLYAACIERAAHLLGGREALARRLGIPLPVLERWAEGEGLGAQLLFLRVVDILQAEEPGRWPPTPTRSSPEASTIYRK
jgi:hypothetical protein